MQISLTLLKRIPIFAHLSEAELALLAGICRPLMAAPHEMIIEQNTTGTEMFVIAAGSVEVFIRGLGETRSLVVLGKGQVFGEMALIDQGYRSASVQATAEPVSLYAIGRNQFYEVCEQNNHIGFVVMRNLAIDISFKLRHRNLAEL